MIYNRRTIFKTLAAAGAVLASGASGLYAQETNARVVEMTIGAEDAPVTIIEYASFTCPHCANFHKNVFGGLKAEFIDTGKVKFILREIYFDRFGLWAGMIARCGGPEKYFGIVDLLFTKQNQWVESGADPSTIVENLKQLGRIAGLTDDAMETCLIDKEMATALVEEFQRTSVADDVRSTPSFVINGEKYGNMSLAKMTAILNEKLAG